MKINRPGLCKVAAESRRFVVLVDVVGIALAATVVLMLSLQHAVAQIVMRPAGTFFSQNYMAEIGKTLASPTVAATARAEREVSSYRATCDAFVPRQPVLMVLWENEAAGTEPTPSTTGPDTRIRLDISATTFGFAEGNYSTIRLSNIPAVEALALDSPSPIPAADGEVLLSRVEANRIVERDPALPVFDSPNVMNELMPGLAQKVRAMVEEDLRTGALGQVRVLGRAGMMLRGESQQMVKMVGVQPGATYRLRLVHEQDSGAEMLFEQISRIPVCPADFMNPGQ